MTSTVNFEKIKRDFEKKQTETEKTTRGKLTRKLPMKEKKQSKRFSGLPPEVRWVHFCGPEGDFWKIRSAQVKIILAEILAEALDRSSGTVRHTVNPKKNVLFLLDIRKKFLAPRTPRSQKILAEALILATG
jgi:hypothetical protein